MGDFKTMFIETKESIMLAKRLTQEGKHGG